MKINYKFQNVLYHFCMLKIDGDLKNFNSFADF